MIRLAEQTTHFLVDDSEQSECRSLIESRIRLYRPDSMMIDVCVYVQDL